MGHQIEQQPERNVLVLQHPSPDTQGHRICLAARVQLAQSCCPNYRWYVKPEVQVGWGFADELTLSH